MLNKNIVFLCLCAALGFAGPAMSAESKTKNPLAGSKEPISIEAASQLEWLRAENKYRATKDVVITQGKTIIRGDTAEALYDPIQGPSALTEVVLNGHVTIEQEGRMARADKAVYDTSKQRITLSGGTVTLTAPGFSVEANDNVQYFMAENKAAATGGVTLTQKEQTLKAQSATAWFDKDNRLLRANADGNVVMTQNTSEGKQVAQAQHARYDAVTAKVLLNGDVRLARGDNFMQGAAATVDLNTGYSSLQNDSAGGRVRAVFTPGGGGTAPLPQQAIAVPVVPGKKNPEGAY